MNFVSYLWFVLYMTKRHSKFTIVSQATDKQTSQAQSWKGI